MRTTLLSPYGLVITLVAGFVASQPASAQEVSWFLPSRDLLPTLLAGPREPVLHVKFVTTVESPTRFGPGTEGEVSLAASVPGFLLAGGDTHDALVFGLQGAVYGHFSLQTIERDLISTDWIILAPLVWHRGDHWIRLAYHHISSHLGDDYRNRFDVTAIDYGRDAVDVVLYVRPNRVLGIYGGANIAYNVHPESAGRRSLRFGLELEHREAQSLFAPFAAFDVQAEEDTDWKPRVNVQIGARFPKLDGRRLLRVGFEFLTGPSVQRQFYDQQVTQWSLGIWVDL
jgi:hypothetical protein